MIRFFVEPEAVEGSVIKLDTQDAEHIRSLRLRPGELFIVCDGTGTEYTCRLCEQPDGHGILSVLPLAQIVEQQKTQAEPSIACTVYLAYSKGERLDYAVQKSVELGAQKIVLFESERCVAVPKDINKKIQRLNRIALETAKQSGRGIVPEVSDAGPLGSALDDAVHADLSLFCYEGESNLHLLTVLDHYFPFVVVIEKPLKKVNTISIITGPEGGFEASEAEYARSLDIPVVSLGPRILRCETAPAAVLSAIMYHTGNL